MSWFNVGDKVRAKVIDSNDNEAYINGEVIYTYGDIVRYKVKLENGDIWGFSEEDLELIEKPQSRLPSFGKVLDEMFHLYRKKNADYGDSFATLFKTFGEAYAFGHIVEKVERLKSLYEKGKLENESVRDSLIDCAAYCVMTIVELDKRGDTK